MNWYAISKQSALPWPPHEPPGPEFQPWAKNPRDLAKSLLFHGTSEPIEGALRGGGYDGILWTSETPDIAQNYIPESGGTLHIPAWDWKYHMEDDFPPHQGFNTQILLLMGCDPAKLADTKHDHTGRAQSYYGCKTYREVQQFLKERYGYEPDENNSYAIKTGYQSGKEVIYPKNFKMTGTLFMMLGKERLKIFDMTRGGKLDGDLTDLDYYKHDVFKKLIAEGYDGVRINDFAQSNNWGNTGHHSIGIFPHGIKKLQVSHIPNVTNYDWPVPFDRGPNKSMTPEFLNWHKQQVQEALAAGHPVPPDVAKEHDQQNSAQ